MIYAKKWESVRSKGKILFAISHGIIAGLIVFLIVLAWMYADEGYIEPVDVMLWFIGCLTGGIILFNTVIWRINESRYQARRKKKDEKGFGRRKK